MAMNREAIWPLFQTLLVGVACGLITNRLSPRINGYAAALLAAVLFGLALRLKILKRARRWFGVDALVVSALIFDGDEILLVEDDEHRPPWFVPPGAHVRFLPVVNEPPHQAVIREVKNKAGIDIHIDGDEEASHGPSRIARPYLAQCEQPSPDEGHDKHYDFYYLARLHGQRPAKKPKGKYEWVKVDEVARSGGLTIPKDMRTVIAEAFQVYCEQEHAER